jgi:hypothetical protein
VSHRFGMMAISVKKGVLYTDAGRISHILNEEGVATVYLENGESFELRDTAGCEIAKEYDSLVVPTPLTLEYAPLRAESGIDLSRPSGESG